jgi:hypothetical protein
LVALMARKLDAVFLATATAVVAVVAAPIF